LNGVSAPPAVQAPAGGAQAASRHPPAAAAREHQNKPSGSWLAGHHDDEPNAQIWPFDAAIIFQSGSAPIGGSGLPSMAALSNGEL